jgi:hypothetical protein
MRGLGLQTIANQGQITQPQIRLTVRQRRYKRRMIVTAPAAQVLPAVLVHRLSPRLTQPLARYMEKFVTRG